MVRFLLNAWMELINTFLDKIKGQPWKPPLKDFVFPKECRKSSWLPQFGKFSFDPSQDLKSN